MVQAAEPGAPVDGFRTALHRLSSAQKSSRGAPVYSLYVNRPLGRVLAAAAYQLRMTPNQVTAISAALTFSGVLLLALAPATPLTGVVVALLLVWSNGFAQSKGR